MEWQPIETAPDNTEILVYVPPYPYNSIVCPEEYHVACRERHHYSGNWLWAGSTGEGSSCWLSLPPTHWMPLPKPPQEKQ